MCNPGIDSVGFRVVVVPALVVAEHCSGILVRLLQGLKYFPSSLCDKEIGSKCLVQSMTLHQE